MKAFVTHYPAKDRKITHSKLWIWMNFRYWWKKTHSITKYELKRLVFKSFTSLWFQDIKGVLHFEKSCLNKLMFLNSIIGTQLSWIFMEFYMIQNLTLVCRFLLNITLSVYLTYVCTHRKLFTKFDHFEKCLATFFEY